MQTCIFCDEWGSAAYPEQREMGLREQIEKTLVRVSSKCTAKSFLAYFQAYTSTFMGVSQLREQFETALTFPEIKGIVVGTRPDCLSPAVLNLWSEFQKKTYLAIEFGVQSFFDHHLEFVRRGHDSQSAINAILKTRAITEAPIGIHLIFGMPNETDAEIIETAKIINSLPIHDVKLHNLHVLKNTPLADLHQEGLFQPVDLETYAYRVSLFLQHLDPKIYVHRLVALASRWDELIAPEWNRHRMRNYQFILQRMTADNAFQGKLFSEINDGDVHRDHVRARETSPLPLHL